MSFRYLQLAMASSGKTNTGEVQGHCGHVGHAGGVEPALSDEKQQQRRQALRRGGCSGGNSHSVCVNAPAGDSWPCGCCCIWCQPYALVLVLALALFCPCCSVSAAAWTALPAAKRPPAALAGTTPAKHTQRKGPSNRHVCQRASLPTPPAAHLLCPCPSSLTGHNGVRLRG